jgi:hypothetical protein
MTSEEYKVPFYCNSCSIFGSQIIVSVGRHCTQYNNIKHNGLICGTHHLRHSALQNCHYADCHILFIVMLNVIMISVVAPSINL